MIVLRAVMLLATAEVVPQGMDLHTVAEELYSLHRDEFVAARDERVRQARAEGDRELAAEIGRLRKPSTAAWLANLLARRRPDEVSNLVQLGDALRRAHAELDGETLRRLSEQRRELVGALAEQARELGRSAGRQAGEGVGRELEDTLTAALADPAAGQQLAAGRLTTSLRPGAGDGGGWLSPDTQQPARARTPPEPAGSGRRQRRQHDRLRRDVDAARDTASEAESSLARAAEELHRAERAEQEAAAAVADRRAELQAAERSAERAAEEAATARRSHETAERRAREARQHAAQLERRLQRPAD